MLSDPVPWRPVRRVLVLVLAVALATVSAAVAAQEPPPVSIVVERYEVTGTNPLDAAETRRALAPFAGEFSGLAGLRAAADALQSLLREKGHSFYRVVLPPQSLDSGVVTLEVVTFPLASVTVEGNTHSSDAQILRSVPAIAVDSIPDTPTVSRALAVANNHPRKYLQLNLASSRTTQDALDARITVNEQRPWTVFSALNNIGTPQTGRLRMSFGGQYGALWNRDHVLTGTITTSPDNADDVFQAGVNYQLPVYALAGWLSAFYVTSDVDVGGVQNFFDISGSGTFMGLSFKRWLKPSGRYRHAISVGIQDRLFDTEVFNAATGIQLLSISNKVRSRPVSVRYDGNVVFPRGSFVFFVEALSNLTFGGHNRDTDYARVSPGAEAGWKALRFAGSANYQFDSGWAAAIRMSGQWADETLIAGERFGVGGERTVRGFEERALAGDNAGIVNFEVYLPVIPEMRNVRFLGFMDIGYKRLTDPTIGQREHDTIYSGGVGMRLPISSNLYFTADYGLVIENAQGEASDAGQSKVHFNLVGRY